MVYRNKRYIKRANSKNILTTYTPTKNQQTVYPDFDFKTAMAMVDKDPVARGAFNHFVDKCMEGGYSALKKSDHSYDSSFEMTLGTNYNFRTEILRKIFQIGKLYNNVFVEIVRTTEGHTKDMNVLDSHTVEPITESNGDPISYRSRIPNPKTGEYATWTKEDMVWIKFGDRSKGFAPVDLKALYETLLAKDYVNRYVGWLWKTGQYRILYNFKSASDQDISNFLAYSARNDSEYQIPFIAKGDMETKVLRDMKETDSITNLLKYYDNQIAINLRIPPVDVGIPDASGRSNADAQSNNLVTHVLGWKKIVEDKINFDLLPKINKSNNLIRFGPVDRFAEAQVFDIIQKMKASGFTNEACEEYLKDKGMFWASKVFEDPVDPMEMGVDKPENPKEKDNFQSRQRNDNSSPKKKDKEVSTRSDQIASRSA